MVSALCQALHKHHCIILLCPFTASQQTHCIYLTSKYTVLSSLNNVQINLIAVTLIECNKISVKTNACLLFFSNTVDIYPIAPTRSNAHPVLLSHNFYLTKNESRASAHPQLRQNLILNAQGETMNDYDNFPNYSTVHYPRNVPPQEILQKG